MNKIFNGLHKTINLAIYIRYLKQQNMYFHLKYQNMHFNLKY
jgi:hypothetical protein